jgi:translation initiation factor IF-3
MTPAEALKIAREQELDLVEIAPTITPPVCKIISWSKFKYEYSKKQKGTQQKAPQMREMWFKPRTDVGGVDFKIKKVIKFLKDKDKVKITIKQGRDRRLDKSFYFEQINKIMESLSEYADIETPPKLEGRNVYAIIKGKK